MGEGIDEWTIPLTAIGVRVVLLAEQVAVPRRARGAAVVAAHVLPLRRRLGIAPIVISMGACRHSPACSEPINPAIV